MLHVQPSVWKRGLKPAQFISWLSVYVQRSGFEVWFADLNLDQTAGIPGYFSALSVKQGQRAQTGVCIWLPDHLRQERAQVQIPAGGRWEHVNFMDLFSWDTVCRKTCCVLLIFFFFFWQQEPPQRSFKGILSSTFKVKTPPLSSSPTFHLFPKVPEVLLTLWA